MTFHHIEWDELDKKKYYLYGASMQLSVRLFIYPPMLVKTRLQLQRGKNVYKGTYDAIKKIFRYEGGIRGFYKGFGITTLFIFSGQVYISVYELVRKNLIGYNDVTKSAMAGVGASLAAQTITVPIDVVSQMLMIQGQHGRLLKHKTSAVGDIEGMSNRYHGTVKTIQNIYRHGGVKGFYRGFLASLSTYAPSSAVWWGSYNGFTVLYDSVTPINTPPIFIQSIAGGCAAIVSSVLTNPFDVLRTRLQVG